MSLSNAMRRIALAAILLGGATALGACSFTPVYSGTLASQPTLDLAYAKPTTRLEQIVYQELALRLGNSESATAPLVMATVAASTATIGKSVTANPNKPYRVTVTVTLTVTPRDGGAAAPMSFTRQASAEYTTSGQVLANTAAATDAQERAAKAAAESLRLALLASLSR